MNKIKIRRNIKRKDKNILRKIKKKFKRKEQKS